MVPSLALSDSLRSYLPVATEICHSRDTMHVVNGDVDLENLEMLLILGGTNSHILYCTFDCVSNN